MSDGMKKLEEDRQDYLEMCDRMGVRPRYTSLGNPDCYGVHAADLKRQVSQDGYPPAVQVIPRTSTSHLQDFFATHARMFPGISPILDLLTESQWCRLAEAELMRRSSRILATQPIDVLRDIVTGAVNPAEIIAGMKERLDEKL